MSRRPTLVKAARRRPSLQRRGCCLVVWSRRGLPVDKLALAAAIKGEGSTSLLIDTRGDVWRAPGVNIKVMFAHLNTN